VSVVVAACLAGLGVAAGLFGLRLLRGPSLADRIVALDALLVTVASGIAVQTAGSEEGTFLNVLVVVSLLAFVGTVTVAGFIERREEEP
jgi:multicomponent Na+:H+ antiporter subunit F